MTSLSSPASTLASPPPRLSGPQECQQQRQESTTLGKRVRAYVALMKPRIIETLLITTVPAMIVAQRGLPSLWLIAATVIGGTLSAGGANAVNMWFDRDIDAVMKRTARRPIVQGIISSRAALLFAVFLEVFSFLWLAVFVNVLAATIALLAALYYIFVYTMWLKRTSVHNIVIGGAAGAAPALVGWAAVTNAMALAPWLMFFLVFVWTPPHFWALACKYRGDYQAAHVPMLPAVNSRRRTANEMIAYCIAVLVVSLLLLPTAHLGWLYGVAASVSGVVFLGYAIAFRRTESDKTAMRMFHWSITYLTIVFCAMAIDQFV